MGLGDIFSSKLHKVRKSSLGGGLIEPNTETDSLVKNVSLREKDKDEHCKNWLKFIKKKEHNTLD